MPACQIQELNDSTCPCCELVVSGLPYVVKFLIVNFFVKDKMIMFLWLGLKSSFWISNLRKQPACDVPLCWEVVFGHLIAPPHLHLFCTLHTCMVREEACVFTLNYYPKKYKRIHSKGIEDKEEHTICSDQLSIRIQCVNTNISDGGEKVIPKNTTSS